MAIKLRFLTFGSTMEILGKLKEETSPTKLDFMEHPTNIKMETQKDQTGPAAKK